MKTASTRAPSRNTSPVRFRRALGLCAALTAAFLPNVALAWPTAALDATFAQAIHGGVVADSWAGTSTPTTFGSGVVNIQIPAGATVLKAYLVSGGIGGLDANAAFIPLNALTPGVILGGTVAAPITFPLAGPAAHADAAWWNYTFDATAVVKPLIETNNGVATGNVVAIPIHERGENTPENDYIYAKILGHTLIVVYALPSAPLRSVTVQTGTIAGNAAGAGGTIVFPKVIANNCPANDPRADPFPLSVSVGWEYSGSEQTSTVKINNTTISTAAGGSDDGILDVLAQLWTGGSFGADAGLKAIGLKGDTISNGAPGDGRLDDELYSMTSVIPDDAPSATYLFSGNGDESLHAMIFQATAKVAVGDADGDGVLDVTEGNCTVDTDGDGVPDYLDTDSDNDCLPDSDPAEAGGARTNSALPAAAHCAATKPFCVATGSVGTCLPCANDFGGAAPACSAAAPVCLKGGNNAGSCALTACGDAKIDAGEGCDDGNNAAGDGCNATCKVEDTRPCGTDAAGATGNASCASGVCDNVGNLPGKCEPANTCGNGKLEAGEGCDDGNTTANDHCSATCKVETGSPCNATAPGDVGNTSCASAICDVKGNAVPGVCEAVGVCGNGVLDANEGCDDGNLVAGDKCDAACKVETGNPCNATAPGAQGDASCSSAICNVAGGAPGTCAAANSCGNGVLEALEGCDDGNTVGGDKCSAACKVEDNQACNNNANGLTGNAGCASGLCDAVGNIPGKCEPLDVCGNGKLEAGEGCDDGNTTAGDKCSATCKVEDGQACNDNGAGAQGNASCESQVCDIKGNNNPGTCEPANTCGNGKLEAGEGCDDGNTTAGDGCNATCKVENGGGCNNTDPGDKGSASCATGVCDQIGNAFPGICEPANGCGNGKLEAGEGCDDGNTTAGDGCNATCKVENGGGCNATLPGTVGNGSCASSICDSVGNQAPGKCEAENVCGNGKLEAGEGCDDGNTTSGDGCAATCKIEDLRPCNNTAPGNIGNASCVTNICNTAAGLPGTCSPSLTCGNAVLEAGEGCDDGNKNAGDGCDSVCRIEDAKPCNATAPGIVGGDSCASSVCDTTSGAPGSCEPANTCGNGKIENTEGCDDGNKTAGDGCSATCRTEDTYPCNGGPNGSTGSASCASTLCNATAGQPGKCAPLDACGNGKLEAGEGCDDGNTTAGDSCNATCKIEEGRPCNSAAPGLIGDPSCYDAVCNIAAGQPGICRAANSCGNGKLEAGEGCDDGNKLPGDLCDSDCKIESGGSCNETAPGAVGNNSCQSNVCNTTSGAPGTCEPGGVCGNGVLEAGEGCDDGNKKAGDGCNASCKVEDGQNCGKTPGLAGNSSCESGLCNSSTGAPGLCAPVGACGNAKLEAGEGCDDGNKADNDGCSASCRVEPGKPCNGDVAGNTGNSSCSTDLCNTSSGQPGTCVVTLSCGNGVKEAGEGCDDGNLKASDGCSALCKIEDTFPCESTASSSCQSGYCGGNNTCQPAGGGSIEGGACATTEDSSTPVGLFGSIGLALAALFGRRKARTA